MGSFKKKYLWVEPIHPTHRCRGAVFLCVFCVFFFSLLLVRQVSSSSQVLCGQCKGSGSKSGKSAVCSDCRGSGVNVIIRQMGPSRLLSAFCVTPFPPSFQTCPPPQLEGCSHGGHRGRGTQPPSWHSQNFALRDHFRGKHQRKDVFKKGEGVSEI